MRRTQFKWRREILLCTCIYKPMSNLRSFNTTLQIVFNQKHLGYQLVHSLYWSCVLLVWQSNKCIFIFYRKLRLKFCRVDPPGPYSRLHNTFTIICALLWTESDVIAIIVNRIRYQAQTNCLDLIKSRTLLACDVKFYQN